MRPLRTSWHYIKHTDLYLLVLALICACYGMVLIYSATHGYDTNKYVLVQGLAVGLGIVAFIIISLIDLEALTPYWKWIFLANLVFQASVFVLGSNRGGNRSWIIIGPLSLQPAEIGKIIFICTLAAHITQVRDHLNEMKTVFFLAMHLFVTMGIIVVASSDMGSALAYLAICVVMMFACGLSIKWFIGCFVLAVASVPFLWNFLLNNYQKNRILVLLDPSIDPSGIAYQTTQSKIAIGAGGIYGQGFLQGNQTQYGMLPEKHTDFIFGVAGEEFGFIGTCLIVLLLSLVVLRLFYVAYKAETPFSSAVVIGLGGMFLFQMFENIFMCIGIMPVMGLTLPFFSYGGTSMVTMFVALGVAAGVRMREKPSWLRT